MAHELPNQVDMLRSKAWVCGSSLAAIAGSNPACVWMSLVCVECCVLSGRYLVPRNATGITWNRGDGIENKIARRI